MTRSALVAASLLAGCAVEPVFVTLTVTDEAPSILDPVQVLAAVRGDDAARLILVVTRSLDDAELELTDDDLSLVDDDGYTRTWAYDVPSDQAQRGEVWSFLGRVETRRAFAETTLDLTFENAPPTATVTLTPAAPSATDSVTATVQASDPDGDPLEIVYRWFLDGEPVLAFGDTLPPGLLRRGQVLRVRAFARDQAVASPDAWAEVVVANTPPGAARAALPVGPVGENLDLVCRIVEVASDVDGDAVGYRFAWTVDGAAYEGDVADTWHPGDTVPARATLAGQSWGCEAFPTDGAAEGPPAPATVVVGAWDGPRTLTPCGVEGAAGPEALDCEAAYEGQPQLGEVEVEAGFQVWTAPLTAHYRIRAAGAQGGAAAVGATGGSGAIAAGTFLLERGAEVVIAVGQAGESGVAGARGGSGGGGGGTFVAQQIRGWQPLVVAGGGGGASSMAVDPPCGGLDGPFGGRGSGFAGRFTCVSLDSGAGDGGAVSSFGRGSGGGGFNTPGSNDGFGSFQYGTGGFAFIDGAVGGVTRESDFCQGPAAGGFGGGGAGGGCPGGGGGGGFSGGQGGTIAGGGGSISRGAAPVVEAGANTQADGWVVIDLAPVEAE
jgi:hypothetical protein